MVRTFANPAFAIQNGRDHESGHKVRSGAAPATAFAWPQVLSCEVMKAFRNHISDRAQNILTERQQLTGHEIEPHLAHPGSTIELVKASMMMPTLPPHREFAHPQQVSTLRTTQALPEVSMPRSNRKGSQWRLYFMIQE